MSSPTTCWMAWRRQVSHDRWRISTSPPSCALPWDLTCRNAAMPQAGAGALHRRHGRAIQEFLQRLCPPPGLRGRGGEIQDAFLAGRKDEALAAVPDQLIDETALVGPPDRIKDRLQAWKQGAAGNRIGTMLLGGADVAAMRVIAEAAG